MCCSEPYASQFDIQVCWLYQYNVPNQDAAGGSWEGYLQVLLMELFFHQKKLGQLTLGSKLDPCFEKFVADILLTFCQNKIFDTLTLFILASQSSHQPVAGGHQAQAGILLSNISTSSLQLLPLAIPQLFVAFASVENEVL